MSMDMALYEALNKVCIILCMGGITLAMGILGVKDVSKDVILINNGIKCI